MQLAFIYPKDIQKWFQKNYRFFKNLEMTQIAGNGSCSLRHYDAVSTKIDM